MSMRPCLGCARLTRNGSRCLTCELTSPRAQRSTWAWEKQAREAVAQHRREHGDWCPGWQREPHQATDLTADHTVPLAGGGSSTQANVQVLCRSCNSRKQDR